MEYMYRSQVNGDRGSVLVARSDVVLKYFSMHIRSIQRVNQRHHLVDIDAALEIEILLTVRCSSSDKLFGALLIAVDICLHNYLLREFWMAETRFRFNV